MLQMRDNWKSISQWLVDYHELAFLDAPCTYQFYCTSVCHVCKFLFHIQEVEKDVKARTKGELGAAKTLCTPFEQPELPEGMALWGPECKWPMVFPCYDCCIYIVMLTCLVQPKFRYPVLCIWKASEEVVVLGPQLLIAFAGCLFGFSSCFRYKSENPFTLCFTSTCSSLVIGKSHLFQHTLLFEFGCCKNEKTYFRLLSCSVPVLLWSRKKTLHIWLQHMILTGI
jgi:hypothetical protein